jgi:hypothetical protein
LIFYVKGYETSIQEIEKLVETISLEEDEQEGLIEEEDAQMTNHRKPLVIKYSDFLAAAIDERKIFTKEKVPNSTICSYGHCSNISTRTVRTSSLAMIFRKHSLGMERTSGLIRWTIWCRKSTPTTMARSRSMSSPR